MVYIIIMKDWKDVREELLSDPATRREYDKLAPRYAIISELIAARLEKGMTQAQIAKKIGTKQSSIARLEAGNVNLSLDYLEKIAVALGRKITLHIA